MKRYFLPLVIVLAISLVSTVSFADVSIDGTGTTIDVSSSKYNISITNNTALTYFGMIENYYSKDYNTTDNFNNGYVANYFYIVYRSGGGGGTLNTALPQQRLGAEGCTILENGTIRSSIECSFDDTFDIRWYAYDKYYVGRLITSGFTDAYNEGMQLVMVSEDNDATGGNDRDGLEWVYGSKSVSATNSTIATGTSTYDTFDQTNDGWSSWYGTGSNDLLYGLLTKAMPSGATNYQSFIADIETTGSDYHNQYWYYDNTAPLNTYDEMFTVSVLDAGNNYNPVRDQYLIYTNPAIVTVVQNITYDGFNDREFTYEFTMDDPNTYSLFNITGNSSWRSGGENTIYLMMKILDY